MDIVESFIPCWALEVKRVLRRARRMAICCSRRGRGVSEEDVVVVVVEVLVLEGGRTGAGEVVGVAGGLLAVCRSGGGSSSLRRAFEVNRLLRCSRSRDIWCSRRGYGGEAGNVVAVVSWFREWVRIIVAVDSGVIIVGVTAGVVEGEWT